MFGFGLIQKKNYQITGNVSAFIWLNQMYRWNETTKPSQLGSKTSFEELKFTCTNICTKHMYQHVYSHQSLTHLNTRVICKARKYHKKWLKNSPSNFNNLSVTKWNRDGLSQPNTFSNTIFWPQSETTVVLNRKIWLKNHLTFKVHRKWESDVKLVESRLDVREKNVLNVFHPKLNVGRWNW